MACNTFEMVILSKVLPLASSARGNALVAILKATTAGDVAAGSRDGQRIF